MPNPYRRSLVLAALLAGAAPAFAQDSKCAVLLLHAPGTGAEAVAALARKLQPLCATRTSVAATDADIGKQVKDLRQHGARRVVLAGHGAAANTVIAYAGGVGDVEAVVAIGGDAAPGDLPGLTPRIKQHIPLLWVVGSRDALAKRGEDYAFAKAPPHPASRYVEVKADAANAPEASARTVGDWIKSLD